MNNTIYRNSWVVQCQPSVCAFTRCGLRPLRVRPACEWTECSLCVSIPPQSCGESGFGPDRGRRVQTGNLLLTLTALRDPVGCSVDSPTSRQAFEGTRTLMSRALIPLEIMLCLPKNTHGNLIMCRPDRHIGLNLWWLHVQMLHEQSQWTFIVPFLWYAPTCITVLHILPGSGSHWRGWNLKTTITVAW